MHPAPDDMAGSPATDVKDAPDLASQLESLLDCVWRCEAEWPWTIESTSRSDSAGASQPCLERRSKKHDDRTSDRH